jgi:hypothetical protein
MINFKIFLPNKDTFQFKNYVQRIHLYVLTSTSERDLRPLKATLAPYLLQQLHGELEEFFISGHIKSH